MLLLLFWSRTQNNAPRTQNKRSADQLITLACVHSGIGETRKRFLHRTYFPLTLDVDIQWPIFHQNWRDMNWNSLVSQLSTWPLLIRSSGNVESSYSDRAMVCSHELQ
jgi:hypothetical protein